MSRAGSAGGKTGGLAAAAGTENAGAVPFTTADKRQKASVSGGVELDMQNITMQLINAVSVTALKTNCYGCTLESSRHI